MLDNGLLMNGTFEHDEEVTSVDIHAGIGLIVSGDISGLIKVWNYRRQIIREVKFTEPISAVSFLNARADLVVGHKGKLSRINAEDYLPDVSFYQMPEMSEVLAIFGKNTAEIPDDFFLQLKVQ